MGFKGASFVWKDRKRFLGMPLSFTRYAMSEDRLFYSKGFLNVKDEEVLLYRVRDISVERTLGQRIFGVGSVTVASSDQSSPTLVLKNVRGPMAVKERLHHLVEEAKIRRRVRVGEVLAGCGHDHDGRDDEDLDDGLE